MPQSPLEKGEAKIPLNPPLQKGEDRIPSFSKGRGRGDFTDREGRVVKLPLVYSFSN